MKTKTKATVFAVTAAALYAVNIPFSKLLLKYIAPAMMAAFLYLGAGLGLLLCEAFGRIAGKNVISEPLTKKELPYTLAMVLLDIAAPILLMLGVKLTNSASASLLNNFEIAATALFASAVFKEVISKRLWLAITLITAASVLLGFEGKETFAFNIGSLFVLAACVCWGFENNCTRKISNKSSVEIVTVKGCFSGMGSLAVALAIGETLPAFKLILLTLLLGFVSYGLSINFYILAQKELGAAKTSAYYSIAPFIGVSFSLLLLGERPNALFYIALFVMAAAGVIMAKDTVALQHTHPHTHIHTHEHSHGSLTHTHEHEHSHTHTHTHGDEETAHIHTHEDVSAHTHEHGK